MNLQTRIAFKRKDKEDLKIVCNLMLKPFYITEREVLSLYVETYSKEMLESVRELIFYASLKVDDILKMRLLQIEEVEVEALKRQLTLCLVTISFINKYNSDFIKSMSKSKTLADFTVSATVSSDSFFLRNSLKEAKDCVNDLLSLIEDLNSGDTIARTFVKGFLSPFTFDSARLWHHRYLSIKSVESHASLKKPFKGRFYKNGGSYK